MGVKERVKKLENRAMPKRTVYLMVGWKNPGETVEEAWERHLREHPEDKFVKHKIIIHYTGWDENGQEPEK